MEPDTIVAAVAANIAWKSQKAKVDAVSAPPASAALVPPRKKPLKPNRPALLAPNMSA